MYNIIYTDSCNEAVENRIKTELKLSIVKRMPEEHWNLQDAARILTEPNIKLAVINRIDEISLMEIGLLLFMCKPVMVADKRIEEYPILAREINYIEPSCNLNDVNNTFISWHNYIERTYDVKPKD